MESIRLLKEHYSRDRYPFLSFGEGTYGAPDVLHFGDGVRLTVGNYCSIGHRAAFVLGGLHRIDWVTTYPFPSVWAMAAGFKGHPAPAKDIVIGSDVWVGTEAAIFSGATIGHGAVVGARSVVAPGEMVPAYGIAVGHPARVVAFRFDQPTREALLDIAWWDWPSDRIARALPLLLQPDIRKFINAVLSKEV